MNKFFGLLLITTTLSVFSQTNNDSGTKVDSLDALKFTLYTENDTIEYLKIGADISSPKPTLLFLQGSLPHPLIFDFGSFKHINIPFDYKTILEQYHLIEIAMPRTPLMAKKEQLNRQYCYVTNPSDENSYDKAYLRDNHLDNYVQRTHLVIDDLLKKTWVKKDSLLLVGHSQGAKIATVVASENEHITAIALLGFNAFGRFDEILRRERLQLKSGQISAEEYQKRLKGHYLDWQEMVQDPTNFEKGHTAWTSFSVDYMPYLLKIEIPIFIAYGTEDIIAENCDLIPLHFIESGKENLQLQPYVGMDHNFFELKDGVPDRKNGAHFTDVIHDILHWFKGE
jgi:pimeloyl-ACP methyl ester carboxylesterase